MDEKTERLRGIFMDVADEETVTETQAEQRGSLVRTETVDERLVDAVGRMRERFDFETTLDDEQLCTVIKRFYDGDGDGEIADELGATTGAVFAARMDLHLVADDAGLNLAAVREGFEDGADAAEVADALGTDPDSVERAKRVLDARQESRLVSRRFRTEFEEILTDADIAVRLTADVQEDGLEEAAEDIETDVGF
jgi:hypothetical protein